MTVEVAWVCERCAERVVVEGQEDSYRPRGWAKVSHAPHFYDRDICEACSRSLSSWMAMPCGDKP